MKLLWRPSKGCWKKNLVSLNIFFYQSLLQLKEYLAVPSKAMCLPSDKLRYMFFNYVELGEFPQVQPWVCINKFLVMFFPFELKGCTNGYIQLMRGETGFFQSSHSFEHHYILLELFLLRKKILKLLQHIVFQDFVAVGAMIVFLHNADWRCPQESVKSFLHSRLLF